MHNIFINRKKSVGGSTLIECLAVVAIIGALISAVASSFVLGLKSYSGQYESESLELELQRAALEMDYYISRAVGKPSFNTDDTSSFAHPCTSDVGGSRMALLQKDGKTVEFIFEPENYKGGELVQGKLSIVPPNSTNNYAYSSRVRFRQQSSTPRPFWATETGGVAYRFEAEGKDGVMRIFGSIVPE